LQGKVLLDNADGRLVAGQFVRVRVPVRSVSDAVIIPDQALVPVGNQTFAYVIVPGKDGGVMASKTTVEVGLRGANRVQVTAGVQSGQQVVTAGQQKLQAPTTPVKLLSPTQVTVPPAEVEELR
jgi:membrane fusion protein (multidrug efflux system)